MKCPICGSEMEIITQGDYSDGYEVASCKNRTCIYCDNHINGCNSGSAIGLNYVAEMWQTRAEKAESELKEIRDRIEAVTDEEIEEALVFSSDGYDFDFDMSTDNIKNLIKQIGGAK